MLAHCLVSFALMLFHFQSSEHHLFVVVHIVYQMYLIHLFQRVASIVRALRVNRPVLNRLYFTCHASRIP